MTVLIDRNSENAASYTGVVDKHACETKLQTLLQESGLPRAAFDGATDRSRGSKGQE
jgi:hypothetical protein